MNNLIHAYEATVEEGKNHPAPEIVVAFAINKSSLDEDIISKWADHVTENCERCKSTIKDLTSPK
jgi:hypothetical protein